jgi:F0F1-type ATP synthase membrane subunit a
MDAEHLLLSFKGGSKITALHRILLLLRAIEKAIQLSPRLFSNAAAAALQFNLMIYCKELHFFARPLNYFNLAITTSGARINHTTASLAAYVLFLLSASNWL